MRASARNVQLHTSGSGLSERARQQRELYRRPRGRDVAGVTIRVPGREQQVKMQMESAR